ncbi:MAG: alpha-hydroxy-acid oxidizing protein [Dehalococcoidia bacterium]|nr:alpha-hydroxy-acid oxidizing protein [Dehalococcoidia bacterium]
MTTPRDDTPINLAEIEARALGRLTPMARDYYMSGATDEVTLRWNREAYERIALRPRALVDVSARDLSTRVLGRRHAWPVIVAPMAFQRLAHPDGEAAVARAAAAEDVTMTLSTFSTTTVEDVAAAAPGATRWFQLYAFRDRRLTQELVARAEAAGCEALVLTVDAPLLGRRERDARNRFALPEGLIAANLTDVLPSIASDGSDSGLAQFFATQLDPSLTWADLEALVTSTRLPVLVKGVLRADDAASAIEAGARGVIVSNHGGRQLDTATATVDALPDVVEAVAGRVSVLVDGGVRRGTDILKALALGADAVLLGRPILWGLVDGESGVRQVLQLLRAEFDLAMALAGCASRAAVTRDLVVLPRR